jgi:uncharacterized RDD family membrane protein YckC
MNCQNCEAPVSFADERCNRCGAKLLHRRMFPNARSADEFVLTADDVADAQTLKEADDWEFDAKPEPAPIPPAAVVSSEPPSEVRWGGFLRRAGAFIVDGLIVLLLSTVMGAMAFIGYKVGLAAHDRMVSVGNAGPLVLFVTFGWFCLSAAYFVLFHGMDGRTIGKRLLGLRVVGAAQSPVTYRQALLRYFGLIVSFALLAVGVLWILVNREKRGWHDLIARTWVVREGSEE